VANVTVNEKQQRLLTPTLLTIFIHREKHTISKETEKVLQY